MKPYFNFVQEDGKPCQHQQQSEQFALSKQHSNETFISTTFKYIFIGNSDWHNHFTLQLKYLNQHSIFIFNGPCCNNLILARLIQATYFKH